MSKNNSRRTLLNYFDSKEDLNKNLNTIGYRVFDDRGNHWGLSTNGDFDQYFSQFMLNLCEPTYKEELTKVINKQQILFLRLGQSNCFNLFYDQLYSKGIWNIVAYYRKVNFFIEGYYFCGVNPENAVKLINSVGYVNTISEEISKAVNKEENIGTYDSKLDFSFPNSLMNFQSLSKREKTCLISYVLGRPTKQISSALTISSKTIETYILRSKYKLGMRKKEEILEFLLQYFDRNQLLEFLHFPSN